MSSDALHLVGTPSAEADFVNEWTCEGWRISGWSRGIAGNPGHAKVHFSPPDKIGKWVEGIIDLLNGSWVGPSPFEGEQSSLIASKAARTLRTMYENAGIVLQAGKVPPSFTASTLSEILQIVMPYVPVERLPELKGELTSNEQKVLVHILGQEPWAV